MVDRAKSLEPLSLVVHHYQAWVNVMADRFSNAVEITKQALELDPHYSFAWWWRGIAETEMEQTDDGVRSLERAPYHMALVHAGLGQASEAISSLKDAVNQNSTWLRIYGPHDPRLDNLRDNRQFRGLLGQAMRGAI
jgi:predicted Zn-dependent protease